MAFVFAGNKNFVELVLKVEDFSECLHCLFLLFVLSIAPVAVSVLSLSFVKYLSFVYMCLCLMNFAFVFAENYSSKWW